MILPAVSFELKPIFTWLYELIASLGIGEPWLTMIVYVGLAAMMFGLLAVFALMSICHAVVPQSTSRLAIGR